MFLNTAEEANHTLNLSIGKQRGRHQNRWRGMLCSHQTVLQNPGDHCGRNITAQQCCIRSRKTNSVPDKNCFVFYVLSTKFLNVNCSKKLFFIHIIRHRLFFLHRSSFKCKCGWFFEFIALYKMWWPEGHLMSHMPSPLFLELLWYSTEICNEYRGEK